MPRPNRKNSGSLAVTSVMITSTAQTGCSDLRNVDFLQFGGNPFFPGLNIGCFHKALHL